MSLTLEVRKGADIIVRVALKDATGYADLSGGSAVSKMRPTLASTTVTATFATSIVYSTERTRWEIELSLGAATTTTLAAGENVYDVLYTDTAGKKFLVLAGNAVITDIISR